MKKIITATLVIAFACLNVSTVTAQSTEKKRVLNINIKLTNNNVSIESIKNIEGFIPDYLTQPETGYSLTLLNKDSKKIFAVKFVFPENIIAEGFSAEEATGSTQTLTETETSIILPALEEAQKVEVYNPDNQKVAEQNLKTIANPEKNLQKNIASSDKSTIIWFGLAVVSLLILALIFWKVLNNRSLSLLVIILTITLLIIGAWILFKNHQDSQNLAPPPSTVEKDKTLGLKALEAKKELTKTDKTSGDLVLEENSDFQIIYLISNDQFMVFINKLPFAETKDKAQKWFTDKGFTQQDLCLLRISFSLSKEISKDTILEEKDVVPSGCSPNQT